MTTLWTLQTPQAYERLMSDGVLRGSWERADELFLDPYRWLVGAMRRRGLDTGGRPPIWAWQAWQPPKRVRPDLRSSGHCEPGVPGVRIELDVNDAEHLPSLFGPWHGVLNHAPVALTAAEEEQNEGLSGGAMEATWERIFDLEGGDPTWFGPVEIRAIQTTLVEVRAEQVRAVTPFVGR